MHSTVSWAGAPTTLGTTVKPEEAARNSVAGQTMPASGGTDSSVTPSPSDVSAGVGAGAALDAGSGTDSLGPGSGALQAANTQQPRSPRAAIRRPATITLESREASTCRARSAPLQNSGSAPGCDDPESAGPCTGRSRRRRERGPLIVAARARRAPAIPIPHTQRSRRCRVVLHDEPSRRQGHLALLGRGLSRLLESFTGFVHRPVIDQLSVVHHEGPRAEILGLRERVGHQNKSAALIPKFAHSS